MGLLYFEFFAGIFGSHEKSQLLVDGESRADGQSLGPALSMQSGFSQTTQPTRLTVHNETRVRRHSVESGETSLQLLAQKLSTTFRNTTQKPIVWVQILRK